MEYVAPFVWGALFALLCACTMGAVAPIGRRFGRAAGIGAALLCAVVLLLALEVPRAIGLSEGGNSWLGLVLFIAGLLCVDVPLYRRRAAAARREVRARHEENDAYLDAHFFATPEAAALSGWHPTSSAHVLRTRLIDDHTVEVLVDTVPSHPVSVQCEKLDRGWIWTCDITS